MWTYTLSSVLNGTPQEDTVVAKMQLLFPQFEFSWVLIWSMNLYTGTATVQGNFPFFYPKGTVCAISSCTVRVKVLNFPEKAYLVFRYFL